MYARSSVRTAASSVKKVGEAGNCNFVTDTAKRRLSVHKISILLLSSPKIGVSARNFAFLDDNFPN